MYQYRHMLISSKHNLFIVIRKQAHEISTANVEYIKLKKVTCIIAVQSRYRNKVKSSVSASLPNQQGLMFSCSYSSLCT